MGIGASLKIQYPILTEPETPLPNTHKVQVVHADRARA